MSETILKETTTISGYQIQVYSWGTFICTRVINKQGDIIDGKTGFCRDIANRYFNWHINDYEHLNTIITV